MATILQLDHILAKDFSYDTELFLVAKPTTIQGSVFELNLAAKTVKSALIDYWFVLPNM